MFNVTLRASNMVTEGFVEDKLTVIVTESPCAEPEVSIPINSTDNRAPLQSYMTELVTVSSSAILNCSGIFGTQ